MQKRTKPSLRSRLIEWILWRIGVKKMFTRTDGLKERVLKSRPKREGPPRSVRRRFHVEETSVQGRPVFTLSRRTGASKNRVLFLHGGAYVYEIMGMQWKLLASLLKRIDVTIVVPLYPLAPEATVLEALPFAEAVYEGMTAESQRPIALMGDSSGGGMAVALAQIVRDKGRLLPKSLVLLSPWLDVTCSDPREDQSETLDPILARPVLRQTGLWYAGQLPPTDPRVSPVFGHLGNLPPMLVFTGTHDLLHPDALRLRTALKAEGGTMQLREYRDLLHVWPSMPIPEAGEALDEIAAFLREQTEDRSAEAI